MSSGCRFDHRVLELVARETLRLGIRRLSPIDQFIAVVSDIERG